jgi:transcriptional regulator
MYIPAYYQPTDQDVRDLLVGHGAADLITWTARGLMATILPLVFDEPGSRPDAGEHGVLMGHVARKNDHWREPALGEAMVIMRGADAYISPSWYATKREHGRVVPTWNYVTAHIHGELVIHDDPAWVEANVRRLTAKHELGRDPAWSVDDAPPPFIAGQLRAIVGVELRISRIEGKSKLSQNRSTDDVDGAIAGLQARDETRAASAMRATQRVAQRDAG